MYVPDVCTDGQTQRSALLGRLPSQPKNNNPRLQMTCWSSPAWRLHWECEGRAAEAEPNGREDDSCRIQMPAVRTLH